MALVGVLGGVPGIIMEVDGMAPISDDHFPLQMQEAALSLHFPEDSGKF